MYFPGDSWGERRCGHDIIGGRDGKGGWGGSYKSGCVQKVLPTQHFWFVAELVEHGADHDTHRKSLGDIEGRFGTHGESLRSTEKVGGLFIDVLRGRI